MITLHPEILSAKGKKLFAVLPYDEFLKIQEKLEDDADWEALQRAKADEGDAPTCSFEELQKMLSEKREQVKAPRVSSEEARRILKLPPKSKAKSVKL